MMFEKLKFYLLLLAFISVSVIAGDKSDYEKSLEEIRSMQALIEYEKTGIKSLMRQMKELDSKSPKLVSYKALLKQKHEELNLKVEERNELIKASRHGQREVASDQIKKTQTLEEIEDEMGIDRVISSVKKKIDETYKDFSKNPETKKWKKKKQDYFRIKEQKKKIILVE